MFDAVTLEQNTNTSSSIPGLADILPSMFNRGDRFQNDLFSSPLSPQGYWSPDADLVNSLRERFASALFDDNTPTLEHVPRFSDTTQKFEHLDRLTGLSRWS